MLTKEEYAANRKKWIEALRSGEYEQGTGHLNVGRSFCCLGVACEVASKHSVEVVLDESLRIKGDDLNAQLEVQYWLGLSGAAGEYGDQSCLVEDNDNAVKSFSEIADIIESNPDGLWAEGTY